MEGKKLLENKMGRPSSSSLNIDREFPKMKRRDLEKVIPVQEVHTNGVGHWSLMENVSRVQNSSLVT